MVIDPRLVSSWAVYRFSGSMHIGSGPSKRWRFSLDPSGLGQGTGISRLLLLGDRDGQDLVDHLRCAARRPVGLDLVGDVDARRDHAEEGVLRRELHALRADD